MNYKKTKKNFILPLDKQKKGFRLVVDGSVNFEHSVRRVRLF